MTAPSGSALHADMPKLDLGVYASIVNRTEPVRMEGEVTELVGLIVESRGPAAALGDFCEVRTRGGRRIRSQVIGFRNGRVLSMPLEDVEGLCLGDRILARGSRVISKFPVACSAACWTVSASRWMTVPPSLARKRDRSTRNRLTRCCVLISQTA